MKSFTENDISSEAVYSCGSEEISYARKGDLIEASYHPGKCGDYRIEICADDRRTVAEFAVRPELDKLIERRVDFIVSNQQCLDSKSRFTVRILYMTTGLARLILTMRLRITTLAENE